MKPSGRSRCGIGLISTIITLMLLVAFALIAGRLFRASLFATGNSEDAQTRIVRIDHIIHALRADVWASRSARYSEAEKRLELDCPGQGVVFWKAEGDGVVSWTEAAGKTDRRGKWAKLGLRIEFIVREGDVLLRVYQDAELRKNVPVDEVLLVSQLRLAGRVAP